MVPRSVSGRTHRVCRRQVLCVHVHVVRIIDALQKHPRGLLFSSCSRID